MTTVSESLKKGIDDFLALSPEVSGHMENCENPHAVTKEQVGLGNLKNFEQATKEEFQSHKENRQNPHAVTKEQVGLGNIKNEEQATKEEFLKEQERVTSHIADKENPHAVTKSQVGLGNVKNLEQATKSEFLAEQKKVTSHIENQLNPHAVTKEQIGLGNVTNAEQATKRAFDLHKENRQNPHAVTKEQVGLSNVIDEEQATKAEFQNEQERVTSHIADKENPHAVTKEQVGLSNVIDEEQATKAEFSAHISGSADRHSASDIMFSDTKSVTEKINELIIDGGSGTMYHNELLERESSNQHPISSITGLRSELNSLSSKFNSISHSELLGREEEAHPVSAISGIEELYGHVLTFEAVTFDDAYASLYPIQKSEFLDSGRIKVPDGCACEFELSVVAAKRGTSLVITDDSVVLFKYDGVLWNKQGETYVYAGKKERYSPNETLPYELHFADNLTDTKLEVLGVDMDIVSWKATLKIKNVVKVMG